jgi:hypothetical protein
MDESITAFRTPGAVQLYDTSGHDGSNFGPPAAGIAACAGFLTAVNFEANDCFAD